MGVFFGRNDSSPCIDTCRSFEEYQTLPGGRDFQGVPGDSMDGEVTEERGEVPGWNTCFCALGI